MTLEHYLTEKRALVESTLERFLPPASTEPSVIHEAMRYAVLGGGKRLRPILAIAATEAVGGNPLPPLKALVSLELIHTYSLVHDDLPALDDDDLRRGRQTTHVVYGEAMAILTGDALLTEAFAWLAEPVAGVEPGRQLRAVTAVSAAISSRGMIGGQVADMEGERAHEAGGDVEPLLAQLEFIHANKTGKLITVSAVLGGLLGGATDDQLAALERYGTATGLAFQIVDDLLDLEEDAAALGKTAGKDLVQGKLTYPALLGAEAARVELRRQLEIALDNAGMIRGPANYLAEIAGYICDRRT